MKRKRYLGKILNFQDAHSYKIYCGTLKKKQYKCNMGDEQHVFGTTLSKIINNSYSQKKKIHKLDGFVVTYSFLSFARQTQVYTHAEKGPLHCCDDLNRSFFLRFFPLIFCLACFKCLYLGNSLYFLLYEIRF